MKINVTHSTRYRYDSPVSLEPHILRLRPRMSNAQRLLAFDIQIDPDARRDHGMPGSGWQSRAQRMV
jgi:hypothetical protein